MDHWKEALSRGWQNPWLAGQLLIWLIVIILSFGVALILRYTSMETSTLPTLTFFINAIALLSGGYIAGKKAGNKGWYFGGMQGVIYSILLALISFLAFDLEMRASLWVFLVCAFGISALGGIFGVNSGEE